MYKPAEKSHKIKKKNQERKRKNKQMTPYRQRPLEIVIPPLEQVDTWPRATRWDRNT